MICLGAEKPKDVGCATFSKQKEYYQIELQEYCSNDVSGVIIEFIVWTPKIGDIIDAKSYGKNWDSAIIVRKNFIDGLSKFIIHFIGWIPQQREQIEYYSKKIQPHGIYTGYKHRPHAQLLSKTTKDLAVGNYVFQMTTDNIWMSDKIFRYLFQGKVTRVNNQNVTIQLGKDYYVIRRNQEKSWRVSKEHVNWVCPLCSKFWLKVGYFCKNCGFTHYTKN